MRFGVVTRIFPSQEALLCELTPPSPPNDGGSRLSRLDRLDRLTAEPIRRYERARPGELVHIDRRCCVVRLHGMLKSAAGSTSERERQLFACGREP